MTSRDLKRRECLRILQTTFYINNDKDRTGILLPQKEVRKSTHNVEILVLNPQASINFE